MTSRIDLLLSAFSYALNDSTVTLRKSRKELPTTGPLPRITHVPLGGSLRDPDMVGEGLILALDGTSTRDKIVAVRQFGLAMYVQAATETDTEQLYHNALAAWYSACSGSVSFDSEEWPAEAEGAGDHFTHGSLIVSTITLMIPVYATAKPLTAIRSTGQDMVLTLGDTYGDGASYGTGHKYHTGDNLIVTQTF